MKKNTEAPSKTKASTTWPRADLFIVLEGSFMMLGALRLVLGAGPLHRPPARMLVARYCARIQQRCVTIAESVVGFSVVPESAGVVFRRAVEAEAVGVAEFLPNPPAIIGPKLVEIAVAVAVENDLRRALDMGPTAHIILIRRRA